MVYVAFSIVAVMLPVPLLAGVYFMVSSSLAVFLLVYPFDVTVRLTGFRGVLSYSDVFSLVELYIRSLYVMLLVSSIVIVLGFAVAFKNSQILQFSIFGLFL